jgi:hypothetical protein
MLTRRKELLKIDSLRDCISVSSLVNIGLLYNSLTSPKIPSIQFSHLKDVIPNTPLIESKIKNLQPQALELSIPSAGKSCFFIFNGLAGTESSQDEHELQEEYEEGKLDE